MLATESWVPEISDERLTELSKRIKPVVRFHLLGLCYIRSVDLRRTAFDMDPRPKRKAFGLKPIADIRTCHTYGYYGCFKPSIAEVLAQIPDEHLGKVIAFEIVAWENPSEELEALNAGYHVATIRLYGRK